MQKQLQITGKWLMKNDEVLNLFAKTAVRIFCEKHFELFRCILFWRRDLAVRMFGLALQ